ncbi:hypothetical protein K469DRAFT_707225 [Zopfia rhizophila CBS 207.26]|uniref:DDE-1 domain-containing protein n=1 Tax=Zopfia rhizophila CBS 207.26 TaxID=1314779 RepID=A0A6A6E4G4_9PEZI|nr:hypothetical protein K469DRAFT_707225 [Zopfia rhizophila CBS 207.26]
MEDTYLQHEDRIQRALKHLSTKASYNLSTVARMFGVDLQRLRRRVKGINSRSTRPKVNQKLNCYRGRSHGNMNSYQIKALELYIYRLDLIGQPPLLSIRDVFKEHFCDLEEVIRDKGIQQRDTWNFDECSFRIGISGSQDVITMEAFKSVETLLETNRDFVSMVETISATSKTIPPLAILKGILLGVSESSYSNDQIALDYIKHFNKFMKLGLVGEWRLLIYNSHGSHLRHEFITYCFENKIWPYALPSYSSHLYKHFHKKRVKVEVRHGIDDFNKTGIWPLNGDIMINRLPTVNVRRATPPPPPTTVPVSPLTPVSAVDIVQYIQKHLQGVDPYTGDVGLLNHRVTKLAKAAVAVAAARERRQIPNKRVVQKEGTVYVADARLRAAKRNKKDKEKGSRHKAVATLNALKANDPPRRR